MGNACWADSHKEATTATAPTDNHLPTDANDDEDLGGPNTPTTTSTHHTPNFFAPVSSAPEMHTIQSPDARIALWLDADGTVVQSSELNIHRQHVANSTMNDKDHDVTCLSDSALQTQIPCLTVTNPDLAGGVQPLPSSGEDETSTDASFTSQFKDPSLVFVAQECSPMSTHSTPITDNCGFEWQRQDVLQRLAR